MEVLTERDVKLDLLRKNPMVWPCAWLTWAACLLVLLRRDDATQRASTFARVLCVSALGYSCAYLLIGVATDMRYHYWSMLAAMLASLVAGPRLLQLWRQKRGPVLASAGIVGAVVLVGVATRVLDFRGFV